MATREVWLNYFSSNQNKGSDEDIQSMIKDVVMAISLLERIYGAKEARLVTAELLNHYLSLKSIAQARGISHHPLMY